MMSFCIVTMLYVLSMAYLFHEFHSITPEARHELQTVPLMLSATLLYIIVIWKKLSQFSQLMLLGGG